MAGRMIGDGWAVSPTGQRRWGTVGAAGLALFTYDPDVESICLLLQHRAEWTSFGNTWAIPGGAREIGETAIEASLRESYEETLMDLSQIHIFEEKITAHMPLDHVLRRHLLSENKIPPYDYEEYTEKQPPGSAWTYTTVLAAVPRPIEVHLTPESIELLWVPLADIENYNLLDAFREALPEILHPDFIDQLHQHFQY